MPQVSFVSGGLFLTRTVFAMLTWLTGHGIWYHLETTYPEQHHSCIIGSFGARTMLLQTLRRSTIEFTPSVQTLPTKQGCRGESDMKVLFFLLWPLTQAIRVAVRVKRLRMNSTSHSHVHCATVKRVQRLRDHSVCWRATFLDVFWGHEVSGNDLQSDS